MIAGEVTLDGAPTIEIEVANQRWSATIDTGFNSDLELPVTLLPHLNAQWAGRFRSVLAGGLSIVEDTYFVDFPFDGGTVRAVATFTAGNEILIGTHLLRDYRLEIDLVERKLVLVRLQRVH